MRNAEERDFLCKLDNGRRPQFLGDNDVKYTHVVSSGKPINMIVRLYEGPSAAIHLLQFNERTVHDGIHGYSKSDVVLTPKF